MADNPFDLTSPILTEEKISALMRQLFETKPIPGGATFNASPAHHMKTIALDTAAGTTVKLPPATGSGTRIHCMVTVKATTNQHRMQVANSTDTMVGSAIVLDNDANAQTAYAASGTDDSLDFNGTTKGGQIGDWAEFVDIKPNIWAVRSFAVCPAGSNVADCFGANV